VFPFLRNDWKMEVTDKIDKNPLDKYIKSFSRSFDNYKSVFWKKKKYD
jgi:S-adenosylmethionine:tRNA-ribosyltransferase-isomerase (queuine synthetase)